MSEKQEIMWVVVKHWLGKATPVKVFDDRDDARSYAKRMSASSFSRSLAMAARVSARYVVHRVKRG